MTQLLRAGINIVTASEFMTGAGRAPGSAAVGAVITRSEGAVE